ncbi:bifunctional DNA primase/polymerase [Mesorhizobium sp. M0029]|uniref:bifunctional DNA primase/polymerase n=1 Tax=Mesorhizobium sp. M0029 TaxID=2956850 RepID=UPI0033355210
MAAANNRRPGAQSRSAKSFQENAGSQESYSEGDLDAIPAETLAEMVRLYRAGFSLLPLGGEDGKAATFTFKDRARAPLLSVQNRMLASKSKAFGIRLDGMLVLDVDTETPESTDYVRKHFGLSPVQTKTRRGRHYFFQYTGKPLPSVELPGIRIDFKAGGNEYVVGPESIRVDGVKYAPVKRLISIAALPSFVDQRGAERHEAGTGTGTGKIPVGKRNKTLFNKALEYARYIATYDDLLADLLALRTIILEMPSDFPDSEVKKIAKMVWKYKITGNLWQGPNSAVIIHRAIIKRLLRRKHGCDAFSLYSVLVSNHGHLPGKPFAIVPDAMARAGLIPLGRNSVIQARDILIEEGLLVRAGKKGMAIQYQLPTGGGCNNYIESQFGTIGDAA